ncbi:DUF4388 domain-containing protein [Pelovirga terrestris]|uniref:DUF4388 domain-containing protein n=1 Tax=Pelovirga terrestris TaxID=2771352 RepID=A0A8J6UGE1_9BACT|nr:DUF4388 domain-containing protein [Pelovirga terrestris]MBD1399583.1 DUF4388 domain-containing protein [Pelovirga terrestris]
MSLQGRLEDLNICSILQLISLGKKSGTLMLNSGQNHGSISFYDGQVVRASSSLFPQGLGTLLCERQLISLSQMEQALTFQQRLRKHQPLGVIISYLYKLAAHDIEQVVGDQIEQIVVDFCRWQEGAFSFNIEKVDPYGSAQLNPFDLILEKGLSPQRLAVKMQLLEAASTNVTLNDEQLDARLSELQHRQDRGRITLLRGMLAELQDPELGGGIVLLILRYASELLRRAIILDVRGSRLVGLGQFGLTSNGHHADSLVRRLHVDISPDSLFAEATRRRTLVRGALNCAVAKQRLAVVLGRVPDDVLVAPLVSGGRVVALLYGDGFHRSDDALAFDAFAVFLSQAGIVMEKLLQPETAL